MYRANAERAIAMKSALETTGSLDMSQSPHGADASRGRGLGMAGLIAAGLALALPLGGCISETYTHGYVLGQDALAQVPIGSSREQVLLALGTPSTTSTIGNEAFYYISQKTLRSVAFERPKVIDQRVIAVYFTKDGTVESIADYGLKDGKVFDFIAKKTHTGGADYGFIGQIFKGATQVGPSLNK